MDMKEVVFLAKALRTHLAAPPPGPDSTWMERRNKTEAALRDAVVRAAGVVGVTLERAQELHDAIRPLWRLCVDREPLARAFGLQPDMPLHERAALAADAVHGTAALRNEARELDRLLEEVSEATRNLRHSLEDVLMGTSGEVLASVLLAHVDQSIAGHATWVQRTEVREGIATIVSTREIARTDKLARELATASASIDWGHYLREHWQVFMALGAVVLLVAISAFDGSAALIAGSRDPGALLGAPPGLDEPFAALIGVAVCFLGWPVWVRTMHRFTVRRLLHNPDSPPTVTRVTSGRLPSARQLAGGLVCAAVSAAAAAAAMIPILGLRPVSVLLTESGAKEYGERCLTARRYPTLAEPSLFQVHPAASGALWIGRIPDTAIAGYSRQACKAIAAPELASVRRQAEESEREVARLSRQLLETRSDPQELVDAAWVVADALKQLPGWLRDNPVQVHINQRPAPPTQVQVQATLQTPPELLHTLRSGDTLAWCSWEESAAWHLLRAAVDGLQHCVTFTEDARRTGSALTRVKRTLTGWESVGSACLEQRQEAEKAWRGLADVTMKCKATTQASNPAQQGGLQAAAPAESLHE